MTDNVNRCAQSKDTDIENSCYGQDTEFKVILGLLPYLHKNFIDVGAEKGAFSRFLLKQGFSGVMFEPCPKHSDCLQEISRKDNACFFPWAVDSTDREADFYISCEMNGEPADYYHSLHCLSDDPRVNHRLKIRVICRSLESLQSDNIIEKNIGILKIDTEGNDLNVLKGMGKLRPQVVLSEFLSPGLYAGWEDAAPDRLIAQAGKLGYRHYLAIKRYHEFELISVPPAVFIDQQWGNLVFIRDDVFTAAANGLSGLIKESERRLFQNIRSAVVEKEGIIEDLRKTCEERLELIRYLHEEADKRLKIIEQFRSGSELPMAKD